MRETAPFKRKQMTRKRGKKGEIVREYDDDDISEVAHNQKNPHEPLLRVNCRQARTVESKIG